MTGIVQAAWHLAIQQRLAGHRVELVCPVEYGRRRKERISGVVVHRLALWTGWRVPRVELSYLLPLFLFGVSAEKMDVVHVHANPYHAAVSCAPTTVIHLQGEPGPASPSYDRALRRADGVICCSSYVARALARISRYPQDRVHAIHNGTDAVAPALVDRKSARAAFGVSPDGVAILFAGRFAPEKGLHVLIDAVRRVESAGATGVVLLVAGSAGLGGSAIGRTVGRRTSESGRSAYDIDLQARSSGLPVRFVGSLGPKELVEFYCAGDIFACPSICQDGFPLTNVEAAAAGLPIVASAAGGIPEAVVHEKNGLLVPAGDVEALAHALLRLIADRELRQRMGAASREIGAQHDWSVVASQVEAVYALAGRRRRAGSSRPMTERPAGQEPEQGGRAIPWDRLLYSPYDQLLEHRFSRAQWACFGKHIPRGSRVLEVGCGTGRLVVAACRYLGAEGVGLDADPVMVARSAGLAAYLGVPSCRFVQGDGRALPFPDEAFDVVLSDGVIEHLPAPDSRLMVEEHARVCRQGGRVIVGVPNLLNLPLAYAKARMGRKYPAYPERSYTVWGLARLLKLCGLRPAALDGYAPTIGLEWYILRWLRLEAVDRLIARSATLSCVLGCECVVMALKGDGGHG